MDLIDSAWSFAVALLLGVAVPGLLMRMLVPTLRESDRARAVNYRGRTVFLGLGVVWLIWAGCAIVAGGALTTFFPSLATVQVLMLAGPFALVAFSVGLVDDAFGSSSARGFRGHLGALVKGRLTTGGFKLVALGVASIVVALILMQVAPWGAGGDAWSFVWALVAAAAIALTSNLVNLTDLRPGRALKAYSALAIAGACAVVFGLDVLRTWGFVDRQRLVELLVLAIMLLGPVFVVWRDDLGEKGMLGDAGANAMGAVAGMMIVTGLPAWGLALYAIVVFALNLLSEKVSFSAVIERTAPLRWIDGLGRLRPEPPPPDTESSASLPSDVGEARYHLEDDHDTEEA